MQDQFNDPGDSKSFIPIFESDWLYNIHCLKFSSLYWTLWRTYLNIFGFSMYFKIFQLRSMYVKNIVCYLGNLNKSIVSLKSDFSFLIKKLCFSLYLPTNNKKSFELLFTIFKYRPNKQMQLFFCIEQTMPWKIYLS